MLGAVVVLALGDGEVPLLVCLAITMVDWIWPGGDKYTPSDRAEIKIVTSDAGLSARRGGNVAAIVVVKWCWAAAA